MNINRILLLLINRYVEMNSSEYHYEEHLDAIKEIDIHPKITKLFDSWVPVWQKKQHNLILYGPAGVGKYSRALQFVSKMYNTPLKYDKRVTVNTSKGEHIIRISDQHYEVDMSLLGCNSKQLWHDIFVHIVDILYSRTKRSGVIVCKNFHEIHSELLDIFYSYIQTSSSPITLSYVLITEQVGFIPPNILAASFLLNVPRPTKTIYKKLSLDAKQVTDVSKITSIRALKKGVHLTSIDRITDNLVTIITAEINAFDFAYLREYLYSILINNIPFSDVIYNLLMRLFDEKRIEEEVIMKVLMETYEFLELFNNNYRPIYHLERFVCYLIKIVHGLQYSNSNIRASETMDNGGTKNILSQTCKSISS